MGGLRATEVGAENEVAQAFGSATSLMDFQIDILDTGIDDVAFGMEVIGNAYIAFDDVIQIGDDHPEAFHDRSDSLVLSGEHVMFLCG